MNIVNDAELQNMFTVGWPHTVVPSVSTVTQDIHVSFAKCHEKIGKLLKVSAKSQCLPPFQASLINHKEYSGHLHFATDAWTSSNHRAFIVWTVHLQHEGKMLVFLLDIVEVPKVGFPTFLNIHLLLMIFESHTGVVLANAFQEMLECFGLEEKVQ